MDGRFSRHRAQAHRDRYGDPRGGVWSHELAAGVGFDLPVGPIVRHNFFTAAGDTVPRELPITIDYAAGCYVHRERPSLMLGGRQSPIVVDRIPQLAESGIRGGWFGSYDLSPATNAIVRRAHDPEGIVYATGFSGHGFMQGLAVGNHVAQLALGQEPTLDLTAFAANRFASGAARTERHLL